jgi:Flp pilus assembly protein TadD
MWIKARQGLSAICLMGLLTACADDHLTNNIRAESVVRDGKKTTTPKINSIIRVAQATAARGDWAIAVSLYRRAIKLRPKNFDAAYGLARALNKVGANVEALKAFQRAFKLKPKSVDAMRGLGNTLIMLDRPAAAIRHFERALNRMEDPRLYNGIAVAYDLTDDYKAAQAFYRVGLKTNPRSLSLRNNLGLSLMLSGDVEAANGELRKVVASPKASERHRLNLALGLVLAGDSKTAESVARFDLNNRAAQDQIAYFETIKSLADPTETRAAIRAHIRGDSQEFIKMRGPSKPRNYAVPAR